MDNKLDGGSLDVERVELERLFAAFPQCFVEGKFDVKKLAALCGEYDDNDFEKYKFEWKGKDASLRLAQQRSMATLRPCPAESVAWDSTQNLYIEGDNLEVLKQLQTAYYRKVKMIYIDPPYNTGKDFVYADDFADPIQKYKEITSQTTKSNPETMGRFHTNWLNMMYPRLRLAANLLTDDGVIFISIDDNEVHNLRKLCDEVFGEENFIEQFNWFRTATPPNLSKKSKKNIEYILCYEKSRNSSKYKGVKKESKSDDPFTKPQNSEKTLEFGAGNICIKGDDRIIPKGIYGTEKFPNELLNDLIVKDGKNQNAVTFKNRFIWLQEKLNEELVNGTRVNLSLNGVLSYKKADYDEEVPPNLIDESVDVSTTEEAGKDLNEMLGTKIFDYPKPVSLIKYLANFIVGSDDIVLDFFSGSATTAHAVMQLNKEDGGNRRFVCVQLPELTDENSEAYKAGYKNICEIGKERIRRAGAKIAASDCHCGLDPQSPAGTTLFDEIADQVRNDRDQVRNDRDQVRNDMNPVRNDMNQVRNDKDQVCNDMNPVRNDKDQVRNDMNPVRNDRDQVRNNVDQVRNDMDPVRNNRDQVCNDKPVDVGFRVFKLDTSNLKTWDATPVDSDDSHQLELLLDRMNTMVETIKTDRLDEDVAYEIMLKMGVPPTYSVTPVEIDGKRAYCIGEECLLLVCLQEGLTAATIERMAEDYLPAKMILSEKCFADDTAMANAHYILRDREIELKLV